MTVLTPLPRNLSPTGSGRAILLSGLGLYFFPIFVDLWQYGSHRFFSYLAADTYYYATVGRNMAHHGVPSFDGTLPTNGFHPLWQLIVAGLHAIGGAFGLSSQTILLSMFAVSVGLMLVFICVLSASLTRQLGHTPVVFLCLPVGVVAPLMAGTTGQHYGTLWSFTNGMETPLLLLLWAFLLLRLESRSLDPGRSQTAIGLLIGLLLLARLDSLFFLPGLAAAQLIRDRSRGLSYAESTKRHWLSYSVPLAILVVYLAINRSYAGTFLPTSGFVKSSFLIPQALYTNIGRIAGQLLFPDYTMDQPLHYRYIQLLVPAIIASVYLIRNLRSPSARKRMTIGMVATGAFVVLLAAYNFLFVDMWQQGYWYYGVSIVFSFLVAVEVIEYLMNRLLTRRDFLSRWFLPVRWAAAVFLVGIVLAYYFAVHRPPEQWNQLFERALAEGSDVRYHFQYIEADPKIVELDDGIVAYATGFHALSGTGLVLDSEAVAAYRQGHILDLAYDRGYRYIASSWYIRNLHVGGSTTPEDLRRIVQGLPWAVRQDLSTFDFSLAYVEPTTPFLFIRFERVQVSLRERNGILRCHQRSATPARSVSSLQSNCAIPSPSSSCRTRLPSPSFKRNARIPDGPSSGGSDWRRSRQGFPLPPALSHMLSRVLNRWLFALPAFRLIVTVPCEAATERSAPLSGPISGAVPSSSSEPLEEARGAGRPVLG